MKFLVIGESMMDVYYMGRITRLNPERHAAPLLSYAETRSCPGGAANVVTNILAIGAEANFVSQDGPPILKSRLLDEEEGVIARFDTMDEVVAPIKSPAIQRAAEGCCAVLVSDYGKGAIDDSIALTIRSLNLPTFADVKVRPDRWVDWCEIMFPNIKEYAANRYVYGSADICVIKQGVRGMKVKAKRLGFCEEYPAVATHVRNVSGAGDTVLAVFSATYMAIRDERIDYKLSYAARIALDFAATAVSEPLTTAPTWAQVIEKIHKDAPFPFDDIRKKIQG